MRHVHLRACSHPHPGLKYTLTVDSLRDGLSKHITYHQLKWSPSLIDAATGCASSSATTLEQLLVHGNHGKAKTLFYSTEKKIF